MRADQANCMWFIAVTAKHSMCNSLQARALSPEYRQTWLLLTMASTISRSIDTAAIPRSPSSKSSKLQRYLLVPMYPLLLKDMMQLVENAWRVINPNRESYDLHETVQ
jgi:hypothetical protein